MKWLKILLGISALLVAGCAAYFSVTGLGVLFSGASVAVMIMAGSLELAKLVAATYLKQMWTSIKGLNKWYLTISVGILMLITSAGIFGFLSNAFQQQNLKLQQVDREISVWQTKINGTEKQIESLTVQLNNLQNNQTKILDNGKVNRSLLRSVDNRDKEVSKLQQKIGGLQDSVLSYNEKINDIKNVNINLEREVGGFRFVAEAFGFDLNTVVKFFIFLIVFVFDPLAIALVVAFNQILMTKRKEEVDEITTEKPIDIEEKIVTPIDEPINNDLASELTRIRLSDEDLKKLEEILLNPPKPNENLVNASKKYDEFVETKEEPIVDEPIIVDEVTTEPILDEQVDDIEDEIIVEDLETRIEEEETNEVVEEQEIEQVEPPQSTVFEESVVDEPNDTEEEEKKN